MPSPADDTTTLRIRRLEELAPIEQVTQRLCGFSATGKHPCPFHEDKRPSFHLYGGARGWYCWSCHEGGGSVRFVMLYQKCSAAKAVAWLEDAFGVSPQSPLATVLAYLKLGRERREAAVQANPLVHQMVNRWYRVDAAAMLATFRKGCEGCGVPHCWAWRRIGTVLAAMNERAVEFLEVVKEVGRIQKKVLPYLDQRLQSALDEARAGCEREEVVGV